MMLGMAVDMRWVVLAAVLALGGCAASGGGAPYGGSLLGQFAAGRGPATPASRSILAAMGNGLVAGAVATPLSDGDRRRALEAEYHALEYAQAGQPVDWKSERGDIAGEVVAYQPYRVGSQDCRQYTHKVSYAGQSKSVGGTACRNADGSWTPLT